MRIDSDVVVSISGLLLSQTKNFVPYKSEETGDYVTPCTVPGSRILSVRRRRDGELEHSGADTIHQSA